MRRTLLTGLLCVLLICSLFAANVAIAIDRGPLDRDRMIAAAEDRELYTHIHKDVIALILAEIPDDARDDSFVSIDRIVERTVTPEWIQTEAERNADQLYAYLDGEDDLEVAVDLRPLRDNAADAIAAEFEHIEYASIGLDSLDALLQDSTSYEQERATLRQDVLHTVGLDPRTGFGDERLASFLADSESYDTERDATREEIASVVVTELAAADGFGIDRLERMLSDESTYTSEQDAFRENRKQEIQDSTDEELSDAELEAAYEERRDDIIEAATAEIIESLDHDARPQVVDDHINIIAEFVAESLATERSHASFVSQYDDHVVDLEADVYETAHADPAQFSGALHAHIAGELVDGAIPETVEPELEPLTTLVVEAVTTDLSYATFVDEYDVVANDIEEALTTHIWEHRGDYETDFHAKFGGAGVSDLPAPVAEDVDAAIELGMEAVLTEMSHAEFVAAFETIEQRMSESFAGHLFDEQAELPDRLDLTEQVSEQAGDELALVRSTAWVLGVLSLLLPALSAGIVAGLYLVSRDPGVAAFGLGVASLLGGGFAYLIATAIPALVNDEIGGIDASTGLIEALQGIVTAMFGPLASQSIAMLVGGGVLVIAGLAIRYDVPAKVAKRLTDEGE